MGFVIHTFKNHEVVVLDKGNYKLEMFNYEKGNYIFPTVIVEIEMFISDILQKTEFELVPNFFEIDLDDLTEVEIKEITERLVEPKRCLEFIKKHDILEKIKEHKPELLSTLEHLIKRWENGFFVIETY